MKRYIALISLALPFYALSAHASPELASKSKCMICHSVETKKVGPSFKQIAAKYKGQKNAEAMLADSMLKGSVGKWGKIPMSAQKISPTDAQALAKWVLTL